MKKGEFFLTPLTVASMILIISHSVFAAAPRQSVSFSHKDWDLICDNTLTCRAVGYAANDTENGATVLLTRAAGPDTAVVNQVMLAHYDDDNEANNNQSPTLTIDNQGFGQLTESQDESWQMNDEQFAAFMTALRQDKPISFEDSSQQYSLSGAGSTAVLLKMDDVQGRVATPGALIKKGQKSESTVYPAQELPVINKAPVKDASVRDMNDQEEALIKPEIMKLISADKENGCTEDMLAQKWQIARLNDSQSLVKAACWMAAYNDGDIYYLINNDMKSAPQLVSDSANDYNDGVLFFSMKGRGLGDCWSHQSWVWDGHAFVESERGNTGRCMLIRPGGAWDLPEIKSKVIEGQ